MPDSGQERIERSLLKVSGRDAGLDLLRLLAMAIVVLQHGLSLTGHLDWTQLSEDRLTFGQFGVGLFCALSGWFALCGDASPGPWLWGRLSKLFPAYWLTTLLAYAIALAIHRPVSLGMFLSQMAGTGYFTHGWDLINGVSWFISLIALCYALTAAARWSRVPILAMAVIGGVAVLLVVQNIEIALSRHVVTFAVAACCGARRRPILLLLVATLLAPLLALQSSLIFAVAALPAFWLCYGWRFAEPPALATAAGFCFEFFLLHGLFLNGAARVSQNPAVVVALGTAATMPAAILLHWAAALLKRRLGHICLRAVQ